MRPTIPPTWRIGLLAAAVGLVLGACAGDAPDDRGPVVGVVLPLTGPDATVGEAILAGIELAAAGTPDSPRLALRILDGEGRPGASRRRRLALDRDPEVAVVVAGAFAATGRALAAASGESPAGTGAPVLLLSPLGLPADPPPGPGVSRLHRLESLGTAAAAAAAEDADASVAGIVAGPGEAARRLAAAFTAAWEAGGNSVAWRLEPDAEGALRPPPGPEAAVDVLWVVGAPSVVAAAAALGGRTADASVLVPGGWGRAGPEALAEAGRSVRVVDFHCPVDPSPEAERFRAACEAAGVEPGPDAARGWDAIRRIRDAIGRAGSDRSSLARSLLEAPPTEGATGRVGGRGGTTPGNPAISAVTRAGEVFLRRIDAPPGARDAGNPPPARDSGPDAPPRSP